MKILYIDDEEINTRLMRQAVNLLGQHDILTAGSAAEGLKLLDDGQPPDLILLDNDLPDIQGLILAGQLRQRYPEMPIVAITANYWKEETWQKAGFSDYIQKPLKVSIVKDLLEKFGS